MDETNIQAFIDDFAGCNKMDIPNIISKLQKYDFLDFVRWIEANETMHNFCYSAEMAVMWDRLLSNPDFWNTWVRSPCKEFSLPSTPKKTHDPSLMIILGYDCYITGLYRVQNVKPNNNFYPYIYDIDGIEYLQNGWIKYGSIHALATLILLCRNALKEWRTHELRSPLDVLAAYLGSQPQRADTTTACVPAAILNTLGIGDAILLSYPFNASLLAAWLCMGIGHVWSEQRVFYHNQAEICLKFAAMIKQNQDLAPIISLELEQNALALRNEWGDADKILNNLNDIINLPSLGLG